MENKLTREDFEGYRSQHLLKMKMGDMTTRIDDLVLAWLDKEIPKLKPTPQKTPKTTI